VLELGVSLRRRLWGRVPDRLCPRVPVERVVPPGNRAGRNVDPLPGGCPIRFKPHDGFPALSRKRFVHSVENHSELYQGRGK